MAFLNDNYQYQPIRMPGPANPQPQGPKKPRGRGGFLSSLISEFSGAGGAAGGAAIGTAVAPGPGTLVGALLGGLLGGGGGRLAENKVRDDRWGVGEAVGEGALSGALGGLGTGFKLAKGGINAARSVGGVDDVVKAAKATAGKNSLDRTGRSLYRATLGIDDIVAPGRTKPLTVFKADDLVDEARKIGLKGAPGAMQRQVAVQYDALSSQLDDVLKTIPNTAPIRGKNGLFNTALKQVQDNLPLKIDNVPVKSEINRVVKELSSLGQNGQLNAAGVQAFKNKLAGRLSNAFTKLQNGQDLLAKEAVDMAFWRQADDAISRLAPAAKELTTRQSKLYGLAQGLGRMTRTAGEPSSLSQAAIRTASPGVRKAENALGRGLMNAGGPRGLPSRMAGGVVGRGIGNQFMQPGMEQPPALEDALLAQQAPDQGLPMQGAPVAGMMPGAQAPEASQAQQNPYSRENLLADIQRDPQNAQDYIQYYAALQEVFNPVPEEPEAGYGRPSAEKYALGTSGLQSIDTLESMLAQDPGAISRNATPGQDLPVVGGLISRATGTGEYRAIAQNIIDSIARARTGAAMRPEEEAFYTRLLPRAGDDPATIQAKIAQLKQALLPFVSYKGGGNQLEDALLQQTQGGF